MSDNRRNGKILSFRQSGEQLRKKAEGAFRSGDVLRALKLYRSALEQDPDDQQTGLRYAVLLYENSCWRSSLKESYRLLSRFPEEEKYYGLIYRNLLALGEERSACVAYERYMMHLYKNPQDGLNLNEEDPPVPPRPPRARYHRLLRRIHRLMEKGDVDRANHLLVHAGRDPFPKDDPVRDLLEIQLMNMTGLQDEAYAITEGMMEAGRLNASQALALIPAMHPIWGPEFTARLLLYAAAVAQTPVEVYDTVRECLQHHQPSMAVSMLKTLLHEEPMRMDVLYDLAVASIQAGDLRTALESVTTCCQLDSCDADAHMLYGLVTDAVRDENEAEAIQKLSIPLYGAAVSISGLIDRQLYEKAVSSPEELAGELVSWSRQSRLMDNLSQMGSLHGDFSRCAAHMPLEERRAFLRIMLLTANPAPAEAAAIETLIRDSGDLADLPVCKAGLLTIRTLEDPYNR